MSEQVPPPALDEPRGDLGDQASRLQMLEEQAAIQAALSGDVHGTDAHEERTEVIDVLEGPDLLDADAADASDDPLNAGGSPVTTAARAASAPGDGSLADELAGTGLAEAGAAMALDEGATLDDGGLGNDSLGVGEVPADLADEDLLPTDAVAAEDLDALVDVVGPTHDPDDPLDPDGYGLPPASAG